MVNQVFMQGLLAALAAGLVTGIGGFMIFLKKRYLKTEINQLLNLAAGVMLAASFFSLLVPSMHEIVRDSRNIYSGALGYVLTVFAGVLLVWILNLLIPHEHNSMGHHGPHFDLEKGLAVYYCHYAAQIAGRLGRRRCLRCGGHYQSVVSGGGNCRA